MKGSLLSKTLSCCFLVDKQHNILEIANLDTQLFFGKKPIAGQSLIQSIGVDRQDEINDIIKGVQRAFKGKRKSCFEYLSIHPNGETNVGALAHYQDGLVYLCLNNLDTTSTIENIQSSIYSTSLFDTLYDALPIGIGLYAFDGSLIYFNKAMSKIFGVALEDLDKDQINILKSPAAPDVIKQAVIERKAIHKHVYYNFETLQNTDCFASQCQEKRTIDFNGQPVYNTDGIAESYIFMMEDVTDSMKQEVLLQESHRKVEVAMQATDIMLWEFHTDTQLFFSENEPINGYQNTIPISTKRYTQMIHPTDRKISSDHLQRMVDGEDFSFEFDCHAILFPDQNWQFCTINSSPCEYEKTGRVTKYVCTLKNNTELHKQKRFYEKILNELPLSILIKDVEQDFRYIFCNKESKDMFDISEEGAIYDILDNEAVELIRKTDLEVFNTGVFYTGLEEITLKDGRRNNTIVRKSILEKEGKRLLLSVRWDQSLQNELKRQALLFGLTLETMSAYTWFYEPDIERVSFSEGFNKIVRRASEINTLQTFIQSIHPDDRQLFEGSLLSTLAKQQPRWNCQFRFDTTGDKAYTWWEGKGILGTEIINEKPRNYLYGMTICIEDHKQIEQTLTLNKEVLNELVLQNELILNNTNSGIAYITTDYIVQWENISKCSTSISLEAYKQGEICYKSAHNRTDPCEDCVLQRAMRSRQVEQISFCLENDRMVEIFASPVIHSDGSINGIVIRMDDITERQQMINELKQAKQRAEQSDKLKSAFLANMSHEIRTPLNAIVGFSELLADTSEEEKSEYIRIIKSNNELLLGLISDILDLSKIESGAIELKYEHFDLAQFFNHLFMSMQQRIVNADVQLVLNNNHPFCEVYLDKVRITQIVTNYVTNAIKYTPKGLIEMGYECRKDGVRFYVKDTGIGISEEKKSKVFGRFAKLDEFAQGTGLGLSICKATAELMNGKVGFESKEGEGSLFWVFLPCTPETKTENPLIKTT